MSEQCGAQKGQGGRLSVAPTPSALQRSYERQRTNIYEVLVQRDVKTSICLCLLRFYLLAVEANDPGKIHRGSWAASSI